MWTLDVVENERQDLTMGNYMEGLHTNGCGYLVEYQWRFRLYNYDVSRMTLLALIPIYDETWFDALAALVVVHLIRPGEGEDDFIVVILNATMCHMELYAGAQEKGL